MMFRVGLRSLARRFCTTRPVENNTDLSAEFLEDYKLGLINQKGQKLLISNEYLKRALVQLEAEGLRNTDTYITVLKKYDEYHLD